MRVLYVSLRSFKCCKCLSLISGSSYSLVMLCITVITMCVIAFEVIIVIYTLILTTLEFVTNLSEMTSAYV